MLFVLILVMLFLIASPIGNLEDITLRALRILKECDYILAEDTRKTRFLLNRHDIKQQKVFSFHKFNEKKKEPLILSDLEKGKNIALISDAGTPLLSDPGLSLIQRCIEQQIPITSIPGPSSILNALILSGFSIIPFQFLGFLPKKEKKKREFLEKALKYNGTSIFFESPYRLIKTLSTLKDINPQTKTAVCREMTKKFEEILHGTPIQLLEKLKKPKGEITLIISS